MLCNCEGHEHEYGFARCTHGRCPCAAVEASDAKPARGKASKADPMPDAESDPTPVPMSEPAGSE